MAKHLTADDILPLVACLTPQERIRLIRLIKPDGDRAAYAALATVQDEFSNDEDPLSWDADGWENVG